MKKLLIVVISFVIIALGGLIATVVLQQRPNPAQQVSQPKDDGTPELTASKLIEGLDHPWDIDFLPSGSMIITERSGMISTISNGTKTELLSPNDVDANGEGGLTGLAVDRSFADNRYVYACFNSSEGPDIRVVRWKMTSNESGLEARTDIVTDLPSTTGGRHSGCQIEMGPDDNLWVGTGDSANEDEPQNRSTLGGKILRVNRDGKPAVGNPDGPDKRIFSYGHRNTQGLAFYPQVQNGSYGVNIEHGSSRDDEVNELKPGNFGWAPGAGYDESVAMTDTVTFPDAVSSIWNSGDPTIAPSGADFLHGDKWGRLQDWLAVSVLKDKQLLLLNIANGSLVGERTLFENTYGRLRAAKLGPDGNLYLSTDNGGNDAIYRVTPS